jgi:hypothetical protein
MQPSEQLVDLEVWTLVFWRGSHQRILTRKEVREQPVLLLPSRPHDRRDPVIAMGGLLFLRLHLLDELRTWCQAIDYVDSNHLKDVLVLEWLEILGKDVAWLTSVAHHHLRVGVGSPIRDGKLCSLVVFVVYNLRILMIHTGGQRHEGRQPVHWMAGLVQAVALQECGVWPTKYPRLDRQRGPQLPCQQALPLPLPLAFACHWRFAERVQIVPHLLCLPVKGLQSNVSFIPHFGARDPSISVGGRWPGSPFSGRGVGSSLGFRSSHLAVMSNLAMHPWQGGSLPEETGTLLRIASFKRSCRSLFLPAHDCPLFFNSSFSWVTLSLITDSTISSAVTAGSGGDGGAAGGPLSSSGSKYASPLSSGSSANKGSPPLESYPSSFNSEFWL